MKNILCIAAFLCLVALFTPRVYKVQAQAPTPPQATHVHSWDSPNSQTLAVLMEAHQLANQSGTRPYWEGQTFKKGEIPPTSEVPDIIAHIIPCENIGRLLHPGTVSKIIDSNGRYSYGLMMIQKATWQGWSQESGITGNPDDANDAISMASWAIEHGQLYQWSCARILGIEKS